MERVVQRFATAAEAERAEREYYAKLTPHQRLEILDEIIRRGRGPGYDPEQDWRAFIESLNFQNVEYMLVGGHAVAYHGRPRFTDDIDFLVRPTPDNARRLIAALE